MGNRINQTFSGRYYKSILHQPNYYLNAYKYNYRNPVEAGLCEFAQDYPYSTLNSILGGGKLTVPILNDDTLHAGIEETLAWVNTKPQNEKLRAVRLGLKKTYFKSGKDDSNKFIMGPDEML